jgi:hypothetical protein
VQELKDSKLAINLGFNVNGSVDFGNICSIKSPTRCTCYVFFIPLYI